MSSPSIDWDAWSSRDVLQYWHHRIPAPPWHAGRTVGRTVYKGDGPDDMIGTMDTRELGMFVAVMRNRLLTLIEQLQVLDECMRERRRWHRLNRRQKLWEVLCGRA